MVELCGVGDLRWVGLSCWGWGSCVSWVSWVSWSQLAELGELGVFNNGLLLTLGTAKNLEKKNPSFVLLGSMKPLSLSWDIEMYFWSDTLFTWLPDTKLSTTKLNLHRNFDLSWVSWSQLGELCELRWAGWFVWAGWVVWVVWVGWV